MSPLARVLALSLPLLLLTRCGGIAQVGGPDGGDSSGGSGNGGLGGFGGEAATGTGGTPPSGGGVPSGGFGGFGASPAGGAAGAAANGGSAGAPAGGGSAGAPAGGGNAGAPGGGGSAGAPAGGGGSGGLQVDAGPLVCDPVTCPTLGTPAACCITPAGPCGTKTNDDVCLDNLCTNPTSGCHACLCNECLPQFGKCQYYSGCMAILKCMFATQCAATGCISACQADIDAAGGPDAPPFQVATTARNCSLIHICGC